jgi:hypothetical protein
MKPKPSSTDLHDGRILLRTLLELFIVQFGVLVQIHLSEQLVDSLQRHHVPSISVGSSRAERNRTARSPTHLFGRILILGKLDHLTGHLVDTPDDGQHLVIGDVPILVDVVQLEGPYRCCRKYGVNYRIYSFSKAKNLITLTLQLFVQSTSRRDTECADELLFDPNSPRSANPSCNPSLFTTPSLGNSP